jgi:DNA-binding MarR family transcriptional regulator
MPKPAVSDLETHLGYWLRFVSNHVSLGFKRGVEAEGVTVAEWVALRRLYDVEQTSPSDLAARMGMTRGAVSRLVERLVGKELVHRAASPDDGRAQIIALTESGRRLVPRLAAIADRNDAGFFAHLSAQESRFLMDLMRKTVRLHGLTSLPVD